MKCKQKCDGTVERGRGEFGKCSKCGTVYRFDEGEYYYVKNIDNPFWTKDEIILYQTQVRNEVIDFSLDMEKILRRNDHKKGWNDLTIHQLFGKIKEEFEELQREYILMTNSLDGVDRFRGMRKEAIDIANYCMFLCHNFRYEGKEE